MRGATCRCGRFPLWGRLFVALIVAPALMGPVYYQSGGTVGQEPPGAAPAPRATELPAAAPLESPLIVTPTARPDIYKVEKKEDSALAVPEEQVAATAILDRVTCARGMNVIGDMAAVAYQNTPSSSYMGVIVAAALVKQQAIDGEVPNLLVLRKRLHAIRFGGTLRDQLLQAYVLAEPTCLPVESRGRTINRPKVERPD